MKEIDENEWERIKRNQWISDFMLILAAALILFLMVMLSMKC